MTNLEIFQQFNTETWVLEQNLCFLLQTYWDKNCEGTRMPENPVSFVKKFMKEETICSVEYAEMSKMNTLSNNEVIDAEFVEVVET